MTTVFIFHGVNGSPDENWFPWLKTKLQKTGITAIVPRFPSPDHPELTGWLDHLKQYEPLPDCKSILVGHSLGSALALRILERRTEPVKATFLVAPVWGVMKNKFDPLMMSFTAAPYDWKKIKKNAGEIHIINSDNDPYITLEKTEALASNLGSNVTLIGNGGHFNAAAGFTEFPQLLNMIQESYK